MKEKCKTISTKKYKDPFPTIGEIIEGKNYDYVSYRMRLEKEKSKEGFPDYYFKEGMFAGAFKVENGKIISLDHDTYYENESVLESEEWTQTTDEGKIMGLTIIVAGEFL